MELIPRIKSYPIMSHLESVLRSSFKWSVNVLIFTIINLVFGCGDMENTKSNKVKVEESRNEREVNFNENHKEIQPWYVGRKTRLGGIVVYENNGAGIVVAPLEWDYCMSWHEASRLAGTLVLNGYEDWRLPSLDEMELIYQNVAKLRNINMSCSYWTGDSVGSDRKIYFSLDDGHHNWVNNNYPYGNLLVIRTFGSFQLLMDDDAAGPSAE